MQNFQSFVRKGWLRPPKSPKKNKTKQKNNSIWCWCHRCFFQVNLIETILNQKLLLNSCLITEVIYLHCFYHNLWMDLCICYSYHRYLLQQVTYCLFSALPGSCVHVLWVPDGPLGPASVQSILPKESPTLPSSATSPGLEVSQLHFHAHWVSLNLALFITLPPFRFSDLGNNLVTYFRWNYLLQCVHVSL